MPPLSTDPDNAPQTVAKHARRKEARPGELLEAALELFVEKGYAATKVEDVATRAGVSKGTLFLYFPSKEDLFKAVVRENISGRFAEWRQIIEHYEGSSGDMLQCCIQNWWQHIGATKVSGISKLMMSEARNFPELATFYREEVVIPGQALIEHALRRGIASGEFRPMEVQYGVYMVLAPLLFLATWRNSLGYCASAEPLEPEKYLATHLDMLLRGFGTNHAGAAALGSSAS